MIIITAPATWFWKAPMILTSSYFSFQFEKVKKKKKINDSTGPVLSFPKSSFKTAAERDFFSPLKTIDWPVARKGHLRWALSDLEGCVRSPGSSCGRPAGSLRYCSPKSRHRGMFSIPRVEYTWAPHSSKSFELSMMIFRPTFQSTSPSLLSGTIPCAEMV